MLVKGGPYEYNAKCYQFKIYILDMNSNMDYMKIGYVKHWLFQTNPLLM